MPDERDEWQARIHAEAERRDELRKLEPPDVEVNLHTLVWGRIERALKDRRNPSDEDLLSAIAGDPTIPEAVQDYARRRLRREVNPTPGRKPEWNLNHAAWQYLRDIILIEKVHALWGELKAERRRERPKEKVLLGDVFEDIAVKRWSAATVWGELGGGPGNNPWDSETAEKRYYEAKRRLAPGFRRRLASP